jgi:peptidoglycan/xylan/chitin deacetylase (PgdA/CDA1 family)
MGISLGKLARGIGRAIPARAILSAAQPAALFFHGVEERTLDGRIQTNHHEAEVFRRILGKLARDFDVLPLAELDAVLAAPQRHARSVFLMSDDGYANTLTVAAPILEEFKLPWTLFVSTRHIGTDLPNPILMARLFVFFAPNGLYGLPHIPFSIVLESQEERAQIADRVVDALRYLPADQAKAVLEVMSAAFAPNALADLLTRFSSETFLDWDGVRALKARGVEIGAHADSHWPMHARQSEAFLYQQACGAREKIESEVGPCRFFAYPFGNVGDIGPIAWRAVRDAGFSHAFTTLSGSLAVGGNRFLLPRYGIGPRDTHIATLVSLLRAGNRRLLRWQQTLDALPEVERMTA